MNKEDSDKEEGKSDEKVEKRGDRAVDEVKEDDGKNLVVE